MRFWRKDSRGSSSMAGGGKESGVKTNFPSYIPRIVLGWIFDIEYTPHPEDGLKRILRERCAACCEARLRGRRIDCGSSKRDGGSRVLSNRGLKLP